MSRSEPVEAQWRIWVDTGGTFTDCLAVTPEGSLLREKVLSSGCIRSVVGEALGRHQVRLESLWNLPDSFFRGAFLRPAGNQSSEYPISGYQRDGHVLDLASPLEAGLEPGSGVEIATGFEAPILAAHWVTGTPLDEALPSMSMRLATTRGTNALLERRGAATALFITDGFADLLSIGDQRRPDLFALHVEKPPPLYEAVVEVPQRMDSRGGVLLDLALEPVRSQAEQLLQRGIRVAAVALLNSYRNPVHETELSDFLMDLGFEHVSCSSVLAPLIKILPRAETAVVNAYLSEAIGKYLEKVERLVEPGPVHVMTSAGSLVSSTHYQPKDSLLSGPAGGVIGAGMTAQQSGWQRSLAFDMGGTSTDVSRFDGAPDYRFETRVGDARLLTPSLAIETVAAGGGSICHFDGQQLKVGPQSAGADPGPACYGWGGPLTVTDVNLLLGRLRPESFEIPIDPSAAESAAVRILLEMNRSGDTEVKLDAMLEGLLKIANERMAEAVRRISIRQGYRPRDFALVAFGGAGGQHACALAEILEMETVLVPENAGLLSAVGLGRACVEKIAEAQVLRPLNEVEVQLESMIEDLSDRACGQVMEEGVAAGSIEVKRRLVFLRLVGQESSLGVVWRQSGALRQDFRVAYEDHYGYGPGDSAIELESIRVLAGSSQDSGEGSQAVPAKIEGRQRVESREVMFNGEWHAVSVSHRESLVFGAQLDGPSLVFERHCATVIYPGWVCAVDDHGCLVLSRKQEGRRAT